MEFTLTNPSLLQRGLRSINRAAESLSEDASSSPQVRLRAFGQRLELLAHDDVVQAATLLPASVRNPGSCGVSVRLLLAALDVAPDTEIRVKLQDTVLLLMAPRWKRRIVTSDASKMRDIPFVSGASFKMAVEVISHLLKRTAHAADRDETRPDRACVVLRGTGTVLHAVATDGQRAATARTTLEEPFNGRIVIHQRALRELRELLMLQGADAVEITSGTERLFFCVADTTVAILPVVVQPADLKDYFGRTPPSRCVVRTRVLSRVLRSTAELSGQSVVTLRFGEDGVTVEAEGPSRGGAEDTIEGERSGPATEVALNGPFLRDAIVALGAECISIEAGGRRDEIVIRPADSDEAEVVLMPMSS